MHKKMTRFALAGKCGSLGLSGLVEDPLDRVAPDAAVANPEKARYPNPAETDFNIDRRENAGFAIWS